MWRVGWFLFMFCFVLSYFFGVLIALHNGANFFVRFCEYALWMLFEFEIIFVFVFCILFWDEAKFVARICFHDYSVWCVSFFAVVAVYAFTFSIDFCLYLRLRMCACFCDVEWNIVLVWIISAKKYPPPLFFSAEIFLCFFFVEIIFFCFSL